jgi:hypothetical protein
VQWVRAGLDQRRGEHGVAVDDAGQVRLLLVAGAELRNRQRAQHDRRQHGDRRDRTADLLEQQTQRDEAEAAAADVFRQRDAEQARFGELGPRLAVETLAAGFDLLEPFVRDAVREDLPREIARRLLLFAQ